MTKKEMKRFIANLYTGVTSQPDWFWRNGRAAVKAGLKIGGKEWSKAMHRIELKLRDPKYKIVKLTRLWWGGRVSTVWVGLDMGLGWPREKQKPVIFETMVFPKNDWGDLDMNRYSTESQAIKGHWQMYWHWSNPILVYKLWRAGEL